MFLWLNVWPCGMDGWWTKVMGQDIDQCGCTKCNEELQEVYLEKYAGEGK